MNCLRKIIYSLSVILIILFNVTTLSAIAKRTKIVIFSDTHMGDTRGLATDKGYNPYSWFVRSDALAHFLQQIKNDNTVKALIINGDFFDNWVCPAEFNPNGETRSVEAYFKAMAGNKVNKPVIDLLNQIGNQGGIKLYYIPGNHDMQLSEKIFKEIIPKINYCADKYGIGLLKDGDMVVEHGNRYDLWNCPNRLNKRNHILPLGFYLSRLNTSRKIFTDKKETPAEFFKENYSANGIFDNVPDLFYLGYAIYSNVDVINMKNIDGFTDKIDASQIEESFWNYGKLWADIFTGYAALPLPEVMLNVYFGDYSYEAQTQYVEPDKARIVVFGHTHTPMITGWNVTFDSKGKKVISKVADDVTKCQYVYINTGKWTNFSAEPKYISGNYAVIELGKDTGNNFDKISLYRIQGKRSSVSETLSWTTDLLGAKEIPLPQKEAHKI